MNQLNQQYRKALEKHISNFLEEFAPLAFAPGFGLHQYQAKDITDFLFDPKKFSLSLKREKSQNLLYGQSHVKLRQSLINSLPTNVKLAIIEPKLQYFVIYEKLKTFFKTKVKVIDIMDIGMGHSIYLIKAHPVAANSRSPLWEKAPLYCVIKQEAVFNQAFWADLLADLGWPSYKTLHIADETGKWEITEFLGYSPLPYVLFQNLSGPEITSLEANLARHAALGDLLGRGDRHLENYLYFQKQIHAIDISFMFREDNEAWAKKYIAGGMYEINCLERYADKSALLKEKLAAFFNEYEKTLQDLKKQKKLISEKITSFFEPDISENQKKIAFLEYRTADLKNYFATRKTDYKASFKESLRRLKFKKKLEDIAQNQPQILEKHPLLKMYYLANHNRFATFFLAEDQKEDIFALIKENGVNSI